MITPRRTRLVRVPDLHAFRRAIEVLWTEHTAGGAQACLLVVPTESAARQLRRTLEATVRLKPDVTPVRLKADPTYEDPAANFVTRDQLYDRLHAQLPQAPRRLTPFEREAVAQAAAVEAARGLGLSLGASKTEGGDADVATLPFQLRPGLVAEILRFYDQLRRQSQQASRFEELIEEAVGAATDVGAERILLQTRFLVRVFRAYEQRVLEAGACDEHALRQRLMSDPTSPPLRRVIITVADWIADPDGLFVADFDLLARMPGVEAIDLVCTEAVLGSGFHERLHNWWPGLEEAAATDCIGVASPVRPVLLTPPGASPDHLWFTERDREEELVAVARRIKREPSVALDRQAVVYKRPLPYLYLAPETFGAAGIPYQTSDGLPFASEPTAAAVDLVLDLVETGFTRDGIVALLRSPHFEFAGEALTRDGVSALDRALSDARYLGELARLEELAARWAVPEALPALDVALAVARELAPLCEPAPASCQIRRLLAFFTDRARPIDAGDPFGPRERRARAAIGGMLGALAAAREAHHDPVWTVADLAASVRRWIEEATFVPAPAGAGVHLIDDRAARYGAFDDLALVGLVEDEWPEPPRRNIFYPPHLLKILGWPSERDRRAAADARFLDLLASACRRVSVSTPTLDDETLVVHTTQLEEIPRARLSTAPGDGDERSPILVDEALAAVPPNLEIVGGDVHAWAAMRIDRPPAASPAFHGSAGPPASRTWSVSALETYLGCPFIFFAQHVLGLEEEPDDENVMDPRRQGRLIHEVFEAFFAEWQRTGHGAVTPGNLAEARAMFACVVDRVLERLPDAEAGLERTRLLGSSAAAGLGEAVLRMEAERPVGVVERLLEHRLDGTFSIATASGPRLVALRGKADRLDLLEDGTFRLIDYKLGWPPDRGRALQLPIYGICAEQQLTTASAQGYGGPPELQRRRKPDATTVRLKAKATTVRLKPEAATVRLKPDTTYDDQWRLGEAVYLAFKGPKRVVPLFTSSAQRDEVLASAQQRLADTLDAIDRGDFPPTPDDVYRCETCRFAPVCRKDYVGDV